MSDSPLNGVIFESSSFWMLYFLKDFSMVAFLPTNTYNNPTYINMLSVNLIVIPISTPFHFTITEDYSFASFFQ